MNIRVWLPLAAMALIASPFVQAGGRPPPRCDAFTILTIHLERNATDNDGEAVILAKGDDEGLRSLVVLAPNGRNLATFAGNNRGIGVREFILESSEPADFNEVLRSFPAGVYWAYGTTVDGECVRGRMTLSHNLAPTTVIHSPSADEVIARDGFVLSWSPVAEAVSYVVSVDNEDRGTKLVAESAPDAMSFTVPADWLEPGTSYIASVAVKTANGNVSSVEIPLTTAEE